MNSVPSKDPTLRELLKVLDQRRQAFLWTAGLVFLLSVVACIFMTRRYQAEGVFELQKSSSDDLDIGSMMGQAAGGASDSLSLETDLQTEVSILQSDTLALRVIKDLNLEQNEDFKPTFNPLSWVVKLFTPAGPKDPPGASLEDSPVRRVWMLKEFSKHLSVKEDSGTRLLDVKFSNPDRKIAAAVVNHLIQALIDYTFQTQYLATNQVSVWLDSQLSDLRKQNEDLQAQVVKLQEGSGIFGVGGTDLNGKPVIYSPILDRMQESSSLLAQARMNTVVKDSVYQIAKSGNAELISQLAGTSMMSQSGEGVTTSLALIQTLRTQESTLKSQIEQDASQYGPAAPKLIEERASLKSVEASLKQEVARVASRAQNDYEVAVATEKGAQTNYDADRHEAEKLNDKTIEYTIVSKEAEESDDLYQDLLKRLKEAGILESLHSSNLTLVDVAKVMDKPHSPNIPLLLGLGIFLGGFLGVIAVLLFNAIDNKIRGTEEIEAMGLPLLGILPQFNIAEHVGKSIMAESNSTEFSEAIRQLRTALLIARSGSPPQVLLVTSGSPMEGKSTVALNLAVALSQYQKKVLLVEADMRRPVLKRRLRLETTGGFSLFLADQSATVEPAELPGYPWLFILPAGPPPPYPSELLGAAPMGEIFDRWRKAYDFVVIDSPPILPVTDSQILERCADTTVLVARAGMTSRVGLERAYKLLFPHAKNPGQPGIGVLLNGISTHSAAYYGYYGTYGYKGYYRDEGGKNG
ncbi:MAG: polysaccharide biosynthesis tyrosine autokinase [Terracidiphilus sp.]